jgi:hypothetical protein
MNKKNILLFLSLFILSMPVSRSIHAGILDDLREDLAFNYGKERLADVILRLKKKAHVVNTQIPDKNNDGFLFMSHIQLPSPTPLTSQSDQLSPHSNELGQLIKLFHKYFPKKTTQSPASHTSHEALCDFYYISQKDLHGYEKRKNELEYSPFFDSDKILPYLIDPTHRETSQWYLWPASHTPQIAGIGTCLMLGAAWKSYADNVATENLENKEQDQQKLNLSDFGSHLKKRFKKIRQQDNKGLHIAGISLISLAVSLIAAKYLLEPHLLHEHDLYQEMQPQHDLMEEPS